MPTKARLGIAILLAGLWACEPVATFRCAGDGDCPQGYRCDLEQRDCTRSDAPSDAGPAEHHVDARAVEGGGDVATMQDTGSSSDLVIPPRDASRSDRPAGELGASDRDPPETRIDTDAARDSGVGDAVRADRWIEDVSALVCDGRMFLDPEPPRAGQTLTVRFYSTTRFDDVQLQVVGAGDPVVSNASFIDATTNYTWSWEIHGHLPGVLELRLEHSGGSLLARCERRVEPG